jgi:tRNA(Ile2)-agmatinylcytidine synthase
MIGEPRLVRLNPNIPWKTRGNAALAARIGHGRGANSVVGFLEGRPVRAFRESGPLRPSERGDLMAAAWRAVEASSADGDAGTDPALVIADRPLSAGLYWTAVRRVVTEEEVRRALDRPDVQWRSKGSGRGLVGAAAALAWRGSHPTWELIAYREPARWGTPRFVDPRSVEEVTRAWPELFHCRDPATGRVLIAPHTACPVLYGLRSTSARVLPAAAAGIRSEPVERWMVFRTNQGTADHVRTRMEDPLQPWTAGYLMGTVAEAPQTLRGGHVHLRILRSPARSPVDCLVFEPTRTLVAVARALVPGDRIRVWGGSGADVTFRVEGIDLLRLHTAVRTGPNPRCPSCGRATGSLGTGRGFRCRRCRLQLPPESRKLLPAPRGVAVGRYHPIAAARRHLAPPSPYPAPLNPSDSLIGRNPPVFSTKPRGPGALPSRQRVR